MRSMIVACLGLALSSGSLSGQDGALTQAAENARVAWQRHDTKGLMAPAVRGVLLQLPGADPSAPVSQAQGAALLREYVVGAEEVATQVRAARVVAPGRGYVELVRRYRVAGTEEVRRESVLLAYRQEGERWILAELRVTRN